MQIMRAKRWASHSIYRMNWWVTSIISKGFNPVRSSKVLAYLLGRAGPNVSILLDGRYV